MLKTFKREQFRYPRGFFKEVNAIFRLKKPQIETEIEKKTKNVFMQFLKKIR